MSGNHSIRFGGEYRLYRDHNYDFTAQTPRLEFSTTWTRGPVDNSPVSPKGQDLASFLLGIPTGGRIQVNASYADQSTYTAWFLQDDYKLSRRLTLNLGIRYEYEGPMTERFNRTVRGFDFKTPNPVAAQAVANYAQSPIPEVPAGQFRVLGGLTFAGVGGQPRTLWAPDRNNFSPRFGLAWSLRRSTVLRAGYGVFFVPQGADRNAVSQAGYTQQTSLVPSVDNGLTFIATLGDPFPNGFAPPLGAAGGLSTDVGRSVSFFSENRPNGFMQRWSVGIQQEFPRRIVMEVSYVGSPGSDLALSSQLDPIPESYLSRSPVRDQVTIDRLSAQVPNPFFPLLPGTSLSARTVARSQLLRPYPQFTGIGTTYSGGSSWYHALQFRLERRIRSGLTVQANYTWSKFMEAASFLNPTDGAPEKVISDQDRPQRLAGSGIWELPFGPSRRFGSGWKGRPAHLAGGWQIQAVYQAQSGAPVGFGNIAFSGDLHDIPLPIGERGVDRWFNADAGFMRDSAKQLASNIRGFPTRLTGVRKHGLNIWDVSALKNFRIKEGVRLQFRSEWLNATNHSFFAAPNTTVTSTLFGTVTSTNGFPRQIYFVLKLLF